jgi:predicted SAM-dependent methyltransferase
MTLEAQLRSEGKVRWLDVGCGPTIAPYFEGADLLSPDNVTSTGHDRYHRLDILHATETQLQVLGFYDVVRMQHVLEHFSFEDAQPVLRNCAGLLKPGGYLIITVPDLRIFVDKYLNDGFRSWPEYTQWADRRVTSEAPNSAYFSYFAYANSTAEDSHLWCYDYEGLEFQLKRTNLFKNIQKLACDDEQASIPFTHSRPAEDVCAIAQKSDRSLSHQPHF